MTQAKNKTIFLHIPKAGGTSFFELLRRHYGTESVFHILTEKGKNNVEQFEQLTPDQKAKIHFISGHVSYGFHQQLKIPPDYITILRNPVDRVLSNYYYIRSNKNHRLHDKVNNLTFEEYLSSGENPQLDNGMTRLISGEHPPIGQCDEKMLEKAKKNLKNDFAIVGILERQKESMLLFKEYFQWNFFPVFEVKNAGKYDQRIDKRTLRLVNEMNALDVELYKWSVERLDNKVSAKLPKREVQCYSLYLKMHELKSRIKIKLRNIL